MKLTGYKDQWVKPDLATTMQQLSRSGQFLNTSTSTGTYLKVCPNLRLELGVTWTFITIKGGTYRSATSHQLVMN